MYHKTQSHAASHLLNGETNSSRIRQCLEMGMDVQKPDCDC
jgi:hypothetical protein